MAAGTLSGLCSRQLLLLMLRLLLLRLLLLLLVLVALAAPWQTRQLYTTGRACYAVLLSPTSAGVFLKEHLAPLPLDPALLSFLYSLM